MTASPWDVRPFDSVGDLRFGSTRAAVRQQLGVPGEILRRPNWSAQVTDGYLERGLFCSYSRNGTLAAVELFGPARPVYEGIDLLGQPAGEVLARMRSLPGNDSGDGACLEFPAAGLSFALRGAPGLEAEAQSVTASAEPAPGTPEFFTPGPPGAAGLAATPITVEAGRIGPVEIGADRGTVRAALGEGMATSMFGTDLDVFFCGLVVEYGPAGDATRIVVNQSGISLANLPVTLGQPLPACLDALAGESIIFEEHEAAVLLPDLGVTLLTARDDLSLPLTAVSVGS